MIALMGMIGASVASWVVWFVCEPLFGGTVAFLASTVAGGFGMYYAVRWAKRTFPR
jgi:hypothetical protein